MMGVNPHVFILILAVSYSAHTSTERVIYVDSSSQTGVNDSSCWEGGYSTPCLSLNLALKGAQHYNHSITILLQPGQHQLHDGSETQLRNMSQLAIVGNISSEGEVVIKCLPLAGLSFFRSSNITMKNLKILSCGVLQNSITKHAKNIISLQSTVFVDTCNNIQLIRVDFIDSNGTGVVLYNPSGVVLLDMCNFINNSLSSVESPLIGGGGGLVIEANDVTTKFNCIVTSSTFANNIAKIKRFSQSYSLSEYFGLGGGISLLFKGGSANNTVQFNKIYLENNIALFGGGVFLDFHDSASGNNVTIDGIVVTNNSAKLEVGVLLPFARGGGISIDFAASQVDYPFDNTVEIINSKFTSNTAQLGGGIAVDVVYDAYGCVNADNKLLIENCSFEYNAGYQGSSAYFLGNNKECEALVNTTLSFSNFFSGHCVETSTNALACLGSVFLSFIPLTLKGNIFFSENSQSALSLISSSIKLLPLAQLHFMDNNGSYGAALHIVDCSSVIVNDDTSIYFESNTASNHGGAMYSEACTQAKSDCFIKHSNSALDPDQWKTNVTFINNKAEILGNSIYMDSIQSCVWPKYDKDKTFCWKGWFFAEMNSCLDQLRSGPAYITNDGPTKHIVYPGECINIQEFFIFDDWGNNITDQTNLQVDVLLGATQAITHNDPKCLCNNPIPPDTCFNYVLQNRSCKYGEVAIRSAGCNGNYSSHGSQILIHPPHQSYGIVLDLSFKTCNNDSLCTNTSDDFGLCLMSGFALYKAYCNSSNYSNIGCIEETICGSCSADSGMIFNVPVFNCILCENDYAGVGYFLLEIALVMIMMTILAVLHINITNGSLNGYILYSQMVTLQFPGLGYTASWVPVYGNYFLIDSEFKYISISLIVYSIWNLNFLTVISDPFCIPGIRTAVGVILLQYVIAACPLLFIIVSYTWIQCYNNGYRFVVYTTRPVHRLLARFWQKFEIQPSLIDTYAGLLLLAYMRFLAVSVKLLMIITFDAKFASSQVAPVPLVIIPILCLLVFVILPMAVLLLYPFKIFQVCLTYCRLHRPGLHALIDAYQGCFKNSATDGREGRYFAGIYLLFRFCYAFLVFSFGSFLTSTNHVQLLQTVLPLSGASLSFLLAGLVLILRPYKNTSHNINDFLILFYMALFSAASGGFYIISIYIVILGPLFVPFMILLYYIVKHIIKCCCCSTTQRNRLPDYTLSEQQSLVISPTTTEVAIGGHDSEDDVYPDRIRNPDEYT